MTRRTMTAVALMLMLSGCGDGDDGARPSSTASNSTATSAPAPTPTPTPTAATYTYEKAADLKSDRTFTGYDRFTVTSTGGNAPTTTEFQSSDTAKTSWGKADSKITFADSGDLPDGGVYSYPGIGAGTQFSISSNSRLVTLGMPSGLSSYQYFAFAEFGDSSKYRLFVIGSPTDPAELNKSVTLSYLAMIGEEYNTAEVKPAALSLDLGKSTLSGTVPLLDSNGRVNDAAGKPIDLTLTGTVDSTKHIKGTLTSADGKLTGEFRGRPFGPGGKELALVIALKKGDGTFARARLTGTLQQ